MSTYLLDANVVIALVVDDHEHHDAAASWFAEIDSFAVSPIVEGALIRFLLRIGESYATAAAVLAGVRAERRCQFWPDSASFTEVDGSSIRGHRQVTDSYLATLALQRSGLLATFDRALAGRYAESCHLLA